MTLSQLNVYLAVIQATRFALLGGDWVRQLGSLCDALCITLRQLWQFLLGDLDDVGRTALIFGFDTIDPFATPRSVTNSPRLTLKRSSIEDCAKQFAGARHKSATVTLGFDSFIFIEPQYQKVVGDHQYDRAEEKTKKTEADKAADCADKDDQHRRVDTASHEQWL